jgi:hypothetical protein
VALWKVAVLISQVVRKLKERTQKDSISCVTNLLVSVVN